MTELAFNASLENIPSINPSQYKTIATTPLFSIQSCFIYSDECKVIPCIKNLPKKISISETSIDTDHCSVLDLPFNSVYFNHSEMEIFLDKLCKELNLTRNFVQNEMINKHNEYGISGDEAYVLDYDNAVHKNCVDNYTTNAIQSKYKIMETTYFDKIRDTIVNMYKNYIACYVTWLWSFMSDNKINNVIKLVLCAMFIHAYTKFMILDSNEPLAFLFRIESI